MERFSMDALRFEDEKQKGLLELSAGRLMKKNEIEDFLDGVESEVESLKGALFEAELKLKKSKNKAGKAEIQSVIEEVKGQIAALADLDAVEFTIRSAG